jgi:hypothetical protein
MALALTFQVVRDRTTDCGSDHFAARTSGGGVCDTRSLKQTGSFR